MLFSICKMLFYKNSFKTADFRVKWQGGYFSFLTNFCYSFLWVYLLLTNFIILANMLIF